MLEKTRELIDNMDVLMGLYVKQLFSLDVIANMEEEELNLLKNTLKLMDCSRDLLIKQAEMIDGMNDKLDKLLEKAEA